MLKELWKYSIQEVADKMTSHLLRQNYVSRNSVGETLYRGPHGLKCAVGVLIEDEDYHLDMEGRNVIALIDKFFPYVHHNTDPNTLRILVDFQVLHDTVGPSDWKEAMLSRYKHYNLSPLIAA